MSLVYIEGTAYRVGDMAPGDCEECDCERHRWDCRSRSRPTRATRRALARHARTPPGGTCTPAPYAGPCGRAAS